VDNIITNKTIYFYIKPSFDSKIILYKFIFEYHYFNILISSRRVISNLVTYNIYNWI
jgi:hypothetical protein